MAREVNQRIENRAKRWRNLVDSAWRRPACLARLWPTMDGACIIARKRKRKRGAGVLTSVPQTTTKNSQARQLTGTAMPRPAASPWKTLVHRSTAATVRHTPIAARCLSLKAANAAAEPALEQAVNLDGSTTAPTPAGTQTRHGIFTCCSY